MTHVLIVEDHEENRNLLKMLLEANGYRVTAAGDGLEALAAARRDPPDAVVSDALMPRMDGFALCRAWMQDAALKAIPFIFYSATYVHPEDEQFAAALGAVRYLIKPLEAEVFLTELRAVLRQWAGHAAPAPAAPLDELAFHALHESALARKVEDKMAQLEAANRKLEGSEARFRSLTGMSSDFYWESDVEHRLTQRGLATRTGERTVFHRPTNLGERRWDVPGLSPDEAGWQAHRAVLDAQQPFRDFEFSRLGADGIERYLSISGDPVFDAAGAFMGYRGVGTDITERKRAANELRARELRYQAVANSVSEAFVTSDVAGRIVGWNASAGRIFGYAEAEVIGQPLTLLIPQRFQGRHLDGMKRVQSGGERRVIGRTVELAGRRKDASEFPLELSLAEWSVGEGRFFTGIIRDITERKAAEEKIQRLTKLYAALSQCNQAIVRCAGEEQLFPQICRVAVQLGGMKMAWIGRIDPDTRVVRIVARFGDHADEYLQGIEISVDADHPRGRGPTGTAVRENEPVWRQEFGNQPLLAPWQERRARFGFGASATLPLRRNGVPVGVLTLYAGEVGAFDEAARNLLIEMAADIGFALDNFAREAARERAEIDLRAAEEQFRGLVEQSIAGIYLIQDGTFAYVNPRFAEIFCYASADELIGRESLSLVAEKDRGVVLAARRRVEGKVQSMSYGFTAVRKDGAEIEVGVHSTRATHKGRPAVIGLAQDISEKKSAEERIQRYVAQIESAFMSTVRVVTSLGEMRDPYTAGHQRRVGEIAAAIGAEFGFDERRQEGLRIAGYLHDVGKLRIPSEILSKPGKLSPIELQLVQGHTQASFDVLKDIQFPWPVAEVALQHHESMDGSGYPQGLKGDAILIEARIMVVANKIDALCSHRPYRPGMEIDKALAEIERGRGSTYDAEVADACLRLFRDKGHQLPV